MPIQLKIYFLYCLIVVLYYLYLKWIYIPTVSSEMLTRIIKGKIDPPIYILAFLIVVLVLWGLGLAAYQIVIA